MTDKAPTDKDEVHESQSALDAYGEAIFRKEYDVIIKLAK